MGGFLLPSSQFSLYVVGLLGCLQLPCPRLACLVNSFRSVCLGLLGPTVRGRSCFLGHAQILGRTVLSAQSFREVLRLALTSGRLPQLPSQRSPDIRTVLAKALGVGRSLARRHFRSHHHQLFLLADWFSFFSRTGEVFLLCEPAASRLGTLLIFCRFGQLFVGLLLPVRFPQGVSRGVYLCHLLAQCALPLACLRALGRPCLLQSGFSPPVFGIS